MAYQGELATNRGNQNLMSRNSIKEVLKEIEFVSSVNEYIRIDDYTVSEFTKAKNSLLEYIFVIDGSKFETKINNEISVGLINVNQCIIDMPKMVSYLGNSFALPKDYQNIKEDIALSMIMPLKGLKDKTISDEKDFFRMFFHKNLTHGHNGIFNWLEHKGYKIKFKESLIETYVSLLGNLKRLNTNTISPCPQCKKSGNSLGLKSFKNEDGSWKSSVLCKCGSKTCYVTDLLQFYEQLNNENSNESLTTQMMLVLERLTIINLIRNIKGNGLDQLLEKSAFVLDGPLAIYSHASWFSGAINEEIFKLKNENQLLLFGIEKTGNFVEHFKKVNNFFKEVPIKNRALYFLNDEYIKKYVKVYHNDSFYGEKNYFGKKLFYKNSIGKLFVVNLAFENESDKFLNFNERNNDIETNQRLKDLIMLMENFSSQAYPNALSFISMANEGAALSSSVMGKKLLNEFVESLLDLKTNQVPTI